MTDAESSGLGLTLVVPAWEEVGPRGVGVQSRINEPEPPGEDPVTTWPELDKARSELLDLGIRRRLFHRAETIPDVEKVRRGLERVELQLDDLLKDTWNRTTAGMQVSQIQVSLSITAGGNIGIASAGAEVSLALIFERKAIVTPTTT